MFESELFVRLIIPDNTARTAFHTLERMGYNKLKSLNREDYYKFTVEDGNEKEFNEKIGKVDVLVNFNKNRFRIKRPDKAFEENNEVRVLVKNIDDDCAGLLSTLQNRLGFMEIKSMEKGVLWAFDFDAKKEEAEKLAMEITEKLLANRHYQIHNFV